MLLQKKKRQIGIGLVKASLVEWQLFLAMTVLVAR
jgi:hypothetical protein